MKSLLKFDRLNRTSFLAYTSSYALILFVLFEWVIPLLWLTDIEFYLSMKLRMAFSIAVAVLALILPIKFLAQRYRDSGISGWVAVIGFIPICYPVLFLMMAVFPGESAENKFGSVPKKSSLITKIVALTASVIFIPSVALSIL